MFERRLVLSCLGIGWLLVFAVLTTGTTLGSQDSIERVAQAAVYAIFPGAIAGIVLAPAFLIVRYLIRLDWKRTVGCISLGWLGAFVIVLSADGWPLIENLRGLPMIGLVILIGIPLSTIALSVIHIVAIARSAAGSPPSRG